LIFGKYLYEKLFSDGPNWYDGNTYSCTKCSFEIFSKEIITKHIDEKHPTKAR